MSIEAMKQALEELEADEQDMVADKDGHMVFRVDAAITALRQAIEQAEQYNATSDRVLMENAQGDLERVKLVQTGVGIGQAEQAQPVGEVLNERGEVDWISFVPSAGTHLYTATPQRQPLTDGLTEIIRSFGYTTWGQSREIAEAIEAAHGITGEQK